MEAEKAKEKAETVSQELIDFHQRFEEVTSNAVKTRDLLTRVQKDLEKQERETEIFKKVINKFYEIRQQNLFSVKDEVHEDASWDHKCACLLDDPAEAWSFNVDRETSTAKYISALQEELESSRSSAHDLHNKLKVGLEIENHLKRQICKLECDKIKSNKLILNKIARLREYHSQQRLYVLELLDEGKSYLNSIMEVFVEKLGAINDSGGDFAKLHANDEKCNRGGSWLSVSAEANDSTLLKVVKEVGTSEALSQALQEKVSALLLLQQEEERHFLERDVNAVLQKRLDELQRSLLQVTNEKVKALMELAKLKQEYRLLQEKINRRSVQEKLPSVQGENRVAGKEGKFKNLLNSRYLKRWIGTVEFDASEGYSSSGGEGYFTGRRPGYSIDEARLKIENATLRDTIGSIEHLACVVRKIRLSLVKAKEAFTSGPAAASSNNSLDEIIVEAKLVKTALGSSLPLSWSGEGDIGQSDAPIDEFNGHDDSSITEKMDSVSAAGFEMAELLILAAQVMKDKTGTREIRDGN
ncbi:hypothetical protein Dimus_026372 [Dionaea muscipula]